MKPPRCAATAHVDWFIDCRKVVAAAIAHRIELRTVVLLVVLTCTLFTGCC